MDNHKFERQYQDLYDTINQFELYDILLTAKHIKKFNEKGENKDLSDNPFVQAEKPIKYLIWLILKSSGQEYPIDAMTWVLGNYYYERMRCPVWYKI